MFGDIRELSFEQFGSLLSRPWQRRITEVHIHHTWRPNHGQWHGERTVQAMRDFHVRTQGWSDIAQHLTIGPDGSLWSGRHLDQPPASAKRHNGNRVAGPLMIEMVGDFDIGQNPFSDRDAGAGEQEGTDQARAAYRAVAAICSVFRLETERIFFHRDFTSAKSCPGTGVDRGQFRAAVAHLLAEGSPRPRGSAGGAPARDERSATRYLLAQVPAASRTPSDAELEAEPACSHRRDERAISDPALSRVFGLSRDFSSTDEFLLRHHVVNLEMGRLSGSGDWSTTEADLDALLQGFEQYANERAGKPVNLVFFAHGGLVDEGSALRKIVLRDVNWWLANGVYPVFFVWETGIREVFRRLEQRSVQARSWSDRVLETTLGPTLGRPTWRRIKNSAFLSSGELGDGGPGGAALFAELLAAKCGKLVPDLAERSSALRLHAVGHSAGAIFHCHFLPRLARALDRAEIDPEHGEAGSRSKSLFESVSFLAPAARVDLFKQHLLPLVNDRTIADFTMFTMGRRSEEDDSVGFFYRKSLLYFVRNACEEGDMPPILGLDESVRGDSQLRSLFGLDGGRQGASSSRAEVVWSPTDALTGRRACRARAHGAFDEDAACMNAVMRRILAIRSDEEPLPQAHLGPPPGARSSESLETSYPARGSSGLRGAGVETRRAVCIGINDYPTQPLAGCVADSKSWGRWLEAEGFTVQYLHDAQATGAAILGAIETLLQSSATGDVAVVQFAGHGTQVTDLSQDESEGLDEAWVPHDYGQGEFVLDDQLGALFDRYRDRGVELILFTDCCHSGSSTRVFFAPGSPELQANSRFLRLTPEVEARFVEKQRARGGQVQGRDSLGWEVHFAACQDHQSAYESGGNGHFTTAALEVLRTSAGGSLTYGQFADDLSRRFANDRLQSPNFRATVERRGKRFWAKAGARPDGSAHAGAVPQEFAHADAGTEGFPHAGAWTDGFAHAAASGFGSAEPSNDAGDGPGRTTSELLMQRLSAIERRLDELSVRIDRAGRFPA